MRARTLAVCLATAAAVPALALAKRMFVEPTPPAFALAGRALGGATPAAAAPAYLTASRIAAVGDGALVIDADSGLLLRTDRAGARLAELAIGRDAGLLAYDPTSRRAYVADRRGDRVVVVDVGATLTQVAAWPTPVEPVAVALTPDRAHLLVVTAADRALVAFTTATGAVAWRAPLARESRGLAISPDGTRALVTSLVSGSVDAIDLATHRADRVALAVPPGQPMRRRTQATSAPAFARASFAVTFLGSGLAVVPFQRETPVQASGGAERPGSYGGGFEPPISHQLAFLGLGGEAPRQVLGEIGGHQPRALAWDGTRDALYIAGFGDDQVLQLTRASQAGIGLGVELATTIAGATDAAPATACGPDGLAIAPDGDVLVWCAFARRVQRLRVVDAKGALATTVEDQPGRPAITTGPVLAPTALTATQHLGLELFHRSMPQISSRGALACASCHPDGRADGLSWRIDKHELQTPVLAGRVVGTHPYKWDGGDASLADSLTGTMKRLGGFGLDPAQAAALAAYVEALPAVRPPTREAAAVARGRAVFERKAGCKTCHDGAAYTDNQTYKFKGTLAESDTPSLRGLAASAPYYHDGSAPTLEAVLRDRGAVHGMADTRSLTDAQVRDLVAFLETL